MRATIALAGDTMLGRKVADRLAEDGPKALFAPEIRDIASQANVFLLNLECCISRRGTKWPSLTKPFFFRAPPQAVETLTWLGVTDVTLANNHALDYGVEALVDTLDLLAAAGIRTVGAGANVDEARRGELIDVGGGKLGLLGITDHPTDFAARLRRAGVAYADLRVDVPPWLNDRLATFREQADLVLVSPHWGPNMATEPLSYVRKSAELLLDAGASLIAGHSAHVFQGVGSRVLFDLGDFIDDYRVERRLHNDLGLLCLVDVDDNGPNQLRAFPLALDYCFTRLADREGYEWVREHLVAVCAEFETDVHDQGDHLSIDL